MLFIDYINVTKYKYIVASDRSQFGESRAATFFNSASSGRSLLRAGDSTFFLKPLLTNPIHYTFLTMFNKHSRYHPLESDGSKATQTEDVTSSATGNPPKAASKFQLEVVETTTGDLKSIEEFEKDPEYAELKPTIGIFSGSALIVGLMIGSGIFSTPGTILSKVGSPGMAMILWAFGGVITYAGTIS